jgi:tetratricopeptide (TPR) repeat protein
MSDQPAKDAKSPGRKSRPNVEPDGKATSAIDVFQSIVAILPSIRLPLQLIGLAITVAGFIIVQLVSPNNVAAMMSAGTVGVSLIIFATLFLILPLFPRNQRAAFVVVMFIIFVGTSIYLVKLTYDLVVERAREITENAYQTISANLSTRKLQLKQEIARIEDEIAGLERRVGQSTSIIEAKQLSEALSAKKVQLSQVQKELLGVRSRQQDLRNTDRLANNVLVELNKLKSKIDGEAGGPSRSEIINAEADTARGELEAAQKIYEVKLQKARKEQAHAAFMLGQIHELKGELATARDYYNTALQDSPRDPVKLEYAARIARLLGDFNASAVLYGRAVEALPQNLPEHHQWMVTNYAVALWHQGKNEAARENFIAAYASSNPATLSRALVAQSYGAFLWDLDDLVGAEAKLREADTIYERLESNRQFLRYETSNNLGGVLLARGKYEDSRRHLDAALALMKANIGEQSLAYAQTIANLVANRSRFGDLASAISHAEFLRGREAKGDLTGFELGAILNVLSEFYIEGRNYSEANGILKRALGIVSRADSGGPSASTLAKIILKLSYIRLELEGADAAEAELVRNSGVLRAIGARTRNAAQYELILGRIALARRQSEQAISHLEKSAEITRKHIGSEHPNLVWALLALARAHREHRRELEAHTAREEARAIAKKWLHPKNRVWPELETGLLPKS